MKIKRIKQGEQNITIIGTSHMDKKSVSAVKSIIDTEKPNKVCVDMCEHLSRRLNGEEDWGDSDIFLIVKLKKLYLLLYQIIANFFENRVKDQFAKLLDIELTVQIGEEKRQACESAETCGAEIVLLDRDMRVNFARLWTQLGEFTCNRYKRKRKISFDFGIFQKEFKLNYYDLDISFGFWKRIKFLVSYFYVFLWYNKKITPEKTEELREGGTMLSFYFGIEIEELWIVLLAERAKIMATKIASLKDKNIVVVVGKDHADVISNYLTGNVSEPIEIKPYVPPKIIKYIIAGMVFLGIVIFFVYSNYGKEIIDFFDIRYLKEKAHDVNLWVIVNMGFGGLAAAILRPSWITIVIVSIVSPIAMVLPALGTGSIAFITEAWRNKPIVRDFDDLYLDVKNKRMSKNRFSKLILLYLSTSFIPPVLNGVWGTVTLIVNWVS